jgi:thimet oligopeptidase
MPSAPSLSFKASTPASVKNEAASLIQKFKDEIQSIKEGRAHDPFTAFSLALGDASAESARVTLPSMVHDEADVRAESNRMKDELANMFSAAFTDDGLFKVLSSYKRDTSNETMEHTKFCNDIMLLLKMRNGGDATQELRTELQNKRKQIEELCTAFCSSINENSEYLVFSDDELRGIDDLNMFPLDDGGMRKVSLKAPSTLPVLKFAENAETRRKVLEALSRKCQKENTSRFEQVLKLRHEAANLVKYPHHAAFQLAPKMVSNVQCATEFLEECLTAYRPKLEQEMELLTRLKRELHPEHGELKAWDMSYYTREYMSRYIGIDEASLRKYFPLEHVKKTILSIYEELLGLKFRRDNNVDLWHDDVECYSVSDASTGELQGYFYLDLFPRKGKYSHQCVYPLRPSFVKRDGERVFPACVNLGNLTPPRPGSPSLLMFREVETFFHEFGHVMHCVLTKCTHSYHSWAWSAVPWPGGVEQDFLEVPSMMLENFVWQPEVLKRLSTNINDGSSLPDETIKALNKSRTLMTGYTKTKYLAMALYDIRVHSSCSPYDFDGKRLDATSLFNAMMKKYTGIDQIPDSFSGASWLHLMQGWVICAFG